MAATLVEILVTVETLAVVVTPQLELLTQRQLVVTPEVAAPIQVVVLTLLQVQAKAQVVLETETVLAMVQDRD